MIFSLKLDTSPCRKVLTEKPTAKRSLLLGRHFWMLLGFQFLRLWADSGENFMLEAYFDT